jgi:hypothetical protein
MRSETGREKRPKILTEILPQYQPIWEAPRSIMEFPEAFTKWGKDMDDFEDKIHAREAGKLYKAMDEAGNIYLMANPWPRRGGNDPTVRTKPRLVRTRAEAEAARKKATADQIVGAEKLDRWE